MWFVKLLVLVLAWSSVGASRQVTLSCGDDDVAERGIPGSPGKRGPIGSAGLKGEPGQKGENGQTDESRDAISRLQERVTDLESQLEREIVNSRRPKYRRNCADVASDGFTENGIYTISIGGSLTEVYCDMETDGGNWTVFQSRIDGSIDFYRVFEDYKRGFGDKSHEFWLGLEKLHLMTRSGSHELRVDLEDYEDHRAFAKYSSFSIGPLTGNYILTVAGYSGNAGNALHWHNGMQFTTRDQENDRHNTVSCAVNHHGAWWYNACHSSNLNGEYGGSAAAARGLSWTTWKNSHYSMKTAEMKFRPN